MSHTCLPSSRHIAFPTQIFRKLLLDTLVKHSGVQAHVLDLDQMRLALRDEYCEVRQRVLEKGGYPLKPGQLGVGHVP